MFAKNVMWIKSIESSYYEFYFLTKFYEQYCQNYVPLSTTFSALIQKNTVKDVKAICWSISIFRECKLSRLIT